MEVVLRTVEPFASWGEGARLGGKVLILEGRSWAESAASTSAKDEKVKSERHMHLTGKFKISLIALTVSIDLRSIATHSTLLLLPNRCSNCADRRNGPSILRVPGDLIREVRGPLGPALSHHPEFTLQPDHTTPLAPACYTTAS
jgi:hypothetical protein